MPKHSAGLLLFRRTPRGIEVLLGHPGGPLWAGKDEWSLPKGEFDPETEAPLDAARREFEEETGARVVGSAIDLGWVRQRGGKVVHAFAVEGDLDPAQARSNTFEMEWPPKSGRTAEFPEVDRVAWFGLDEARAKVRPAQAPFLERLQAALGG